MGDKTGISWTDATWNPVSGCTQVSEGCDNCYAKAVAARFPNAYPNGFQVTLWPDRLDQPLRWSRPRRIFVNSMSDLFHDEVPDEFIAMVFAVMALAPRHTFQILTKRPGRMRSLMTSSCVIDVPGSALSFEQMVRNAAWNLRNQWLSHHPGKASSFPKGDEFTWPLPNVWLGVSVENQKWADVRIPQLLGTPAAVRFLSCEPLLGPVDLRGGLGWTMHDGGTGNSVGIPPVDWVIVGGESGPDARPMHPDWARSLRDQCTGHGIPFLFKQWGEWAAGHRNVQLSKYRWRYESRRFAPDGTSYRANEPDLYSYPGMESLLRVGKRAAGRLLDGRTWDEYPEETR